MRRLDLLATFSCVLACLDCGCSKTSNEPSPTAESSSTASVASLHQEDPEDDHHHDEPCDDDHHAGAKLLHPTPTKSKDKDGNEVTHFGPALTIEQHTTVADIQKDSAKYLEKTVLMEGYVTAGCKRRRGWFAIVDDRRSGNPMRVLTTPSFRTPVDAVGKRVRVEGKVTTIEVPAATARHMAKEHALPVPKETTGKVKQTVIEATSADFY